MTNQTATLTAGQHVQRVQPGDYTDGRGGTVLEVNTEQQRARVLWTLRLIKR